MMREKMESKTGVESGFTGLEDEQDVGNYNLVNLNIQKILMRITTNYESGLAGFGDEQDELVSKAAEPEVEYNAGENGK